MKTRVFLVAAILASIPAGFARATSTSPEELLARLTAIEKRNASLQEEVAVLRRLVKSQSAATNVRKSGGSLREAFASESRPPVSNLTNVPTKADRAPDWSWDGFYVGAHAGYSGGNARGSTLETLVTSIDQRMQGGIVGAQIGVNHQIGRSVVGLELSGTWSNVAGASDCFGANNDAFNQTFTGLGGVIPDLSPQRSCRVNQKWSAQFLGKYGYAAGDGRILPYVLAGMAFTGFDSTMQVSVPLPPIAGTGSRVLGITPWGSSNQHAGAVVGAGVQYAVTPKISIGLEYLYSMFDLREHGSSASYTRVIGLGPGQIADTSTLSSFNSTPLGLTTQTARMVLNYKLD